MKKLYELLDAKRTQVDESVFRKVLNKYKVKKSQYDKVMGSKRGNITQ